MKGYIASHEGVDVKGFLPECGLLESNPNGCQ